MYRYVGKAFGGPLDGKELGSNDNVIRAAVVRPMSVRMPEITANPITAEPYDTGVSICTYLLQAWGSRGETEYQWHAQGDEHRADARLGQTQKWITTQLERHMDSETRREQLLAEISRVFSIPPVLFDVYRRWANDVARQQRELAEQYRTFSADNASMWVRPLLEDGTPDPNNVTEWNGRLEINLSPQGDRPLRVSREDIDPIDFRRERTSNWASVGEDSSEPLTIRPEGRYTLQPRMLRQVNHETHGNLDSVNYDLSEFTQPPNEWDMDPGAAGMQFDLVPLDLCYKKVSGIECGESTVEGHDLCEAHLQAIRDQHAAAPKADQKRRFF